MNEWITVDRATEKCQVIISAKSARWLSGDWEMSVFFMSNHYFCKIGALTMRMRDVKSPLPQNMHVDRATKKCQATINLFSIFYFIDRCQKCRHFFCKICFLFHWEMSKMSSHYFSQIVHTDCANEGCQVTDLHFGQIFWRESIRLTHFAKDESHSYSTVNNNVTVLIINLVSNLHSKK